MAWVYPMVQGITAVAHDGSVTDRTPGAMRGVGSAPSVGMMPSMFGSGAWNVNTGGGVMKDVSATGGTPTAQTSPYTAVPQVSSGGGINPVMIIGGAAVLVVLVVLLKKKGKK